MHLGFRAGGAGWRRHAAVLPVLVSHSEIRWGIVGAAALLWVFWPTLSELAARWGSDPRYSHGYLVPLFAGYLLWARRDRRDPSTVASARPSWLGLPLVVAGLALRFAGTYLFFDWLAAVALLPCLAGLVLLVGGWRALGRAWPAVGFLVFMVPLPFRLEIALAHPLQRVATIASTYILQTLGVVAFSEGNVIRLGAIRIGVVEACSGLSMLVIFFALSTAVILLIRRSLLVKVTIFASAIPIALAANITRITVTAILHKTVGSELADYVFHDLAGWLMMPLALAMLWLELRLIAWTFPLVSREPQALAFSKGMLIGARTRGSAASAPGTTAKPPSVTPGPVTP